MDPQSQASTTDSGPAPNVQNGTLLPDNSDRNTAMTIQIYVSPVLVVLGTCGNVLSFLVLLRRRMRTTAMYNFLLILAVADTIVLWVSCFKSWMRAVSGFELLHDSEAACKTINFLFLSSTYLASWLIVLMTIHRFLAIWFPLEVQSKWNLQHARMASIILIFMAFASNIHVFWTFGIFDDNDEHYLGDKKEKSTDWTNNSTSVFNETVTSTTSEPINWVCTYNHKMSFMLYGFDVLKLFLYCLIPFGIVLVINVLIIYRINRSTRFLHEESKSCMCQSVPNDHRGESHLSRDRITYLLLTVSFTWLFLMLPYSLLNYIDTFHETKVLRILCFMLMYANHSINFLLYCLTGMKFREELFCMFRMCKCKRQIYRKDSGMGTLKTEIVTDRVPLKQLKNHEVSDMRTNLKQSLTETPPKNNKSLT